MVVCDAITDCCCWTDNVTGVFYRVGEFCFSRLCQVGKVDMPQTIVRGSCATEDSVAFVCDRDGVFGEDGLTTGIAQLAYRDERGGQLRQNVSDRCGLWESRWKCKSGRVTGVDRAFVRELDLNARIGVAFVRTGCMGCEIVRGAASIDDGDGIGACCMGNSILGRMEDFFRYFSF